LRPVVELDRDILGFESPVSDLALSGKSRKILSRTSWYLASRSSLVSAIRSLAGVAPAEPARSPSKPLSSVSDVALDGADELAATLPSPKARSKSARRMIFIAGTAGGGVVLLEACISDRGVGLRESQHYISQEHTHV
jgi:hypothetical protein